MKYKFNLKIEVDCTFQIPDILDRVKKDVEDGKWFGGRSEGIYWAYENYDWSIEKEEDSDGKAD